jgi:hypothetical protein
MTRDEFWRLIEMTRPPDNDKYRHCEAMTDSLAWLEPTEIVHFHHIFHEMSQADALEEGGCDDRLILDHLRAGARHARTCWVINGLKGKW